MIWLLLAQRAGASWPASAIQDTVAAIMRERAYQRSVRATLLERILGWIAGLLRRLFSAVSEVPNAKWIILGLAILVLVAIAARITLGAGAEARRRRARPGSVVGAGDPWVDADRLAASGEYTEAAHLLYRGVVERLAASQLVRPHASKTSGDYARELRQRGWAASAEFRQFGRRYEHAIFGVGSCDAATYAGLRDQAARMFWREERAA